MIPNNPFFPSRHRPPPPSFSSPSRTCHPYAAAACLAPQRSLFLDRASLFPDRVLVGLPPPPSPYDRCRGLRRSLGRRRAPARYSHTLLFPVCCAKSSSQILTSSYMAIWCLLTSNFLQKIIGFTPPMSLPFTRSAPVMYVFVYADSLFWIENKASNVVV